MAPDLEDQTGANVMAESAGPASAGDSSRRGMPIQTRTL